GGGTIAAVPERRRRGCGRRACGSHRPARVMTVTIVSGATQGLGEAVARRLVADGATGLVLSGRSAGRGRALAEELTGLGTTTVFVEADIGDATSPSSIVAACDEHFGVVHGV